MSRRSACVLLGVAALGLAAPASAHPLDPVVVTLTEVAPGRFLSHWTVPVGREAPEDVTLEPPCATDGAVHVCGAEGLRGRRLTVHGAGPGEVLVRLRKDASEQTLVASGGQLTVPDAPTGVAGFLRLGVEHIAAGVDHLLFVLLLMLLVPGAGPLVGAVTAFTVGHSVTLGAAFVGLVRVPSGPVEVLIAASVALLALERIRPMADRGLAGRRPLVASGLFGLLHGFGFAGALREVGVPAGEIAPALLGFNAGVELGQLAFVALVLLGMAGLRAVRIERWQVPVAYAAGAVAVAWTLERLRNLLET